MIYYPEKITLATIDPHGAQEFVEHHFGLLRRYFNFEGSKEDACANITWNQICHSDVEMKPVFGAKINWNFEFGVHFVNTPFHPQGPMTLNELSTFISKRLTKAANSNHWSQWHIERSGFLVRDLTPVVRSLQAKKVPFLLTSRSATFSPSSPAKLEKLTAKESPELVWFQKLKRWDDREDIGMKTPSTLQHERLDNSYGPDPVVMFSLFVEVPHGLIFEITSEYFNASAVEDVSVIDFRRPCDEHEFGIHPRLHNPLDSDWLTAVYGDEVSKQKPDPSAISIRHYTFASLDPVSDGKDVLKILSESAAGTYPGPGQFRFVHLTLYT
jgi:hypothetical protein